MKKIFGILTVGALMLTSCLDDGDSTPKGYIADFSTVDIATGGYACYMDNGYTVVLNSSSFSTPLKPGQRLHVTVAAASDIITGIVNKTLDPKQNITDVDLMDVQGVDVKNFLTQEQAEEKHLLEKDSLSAIYAISTQVANGYLSTICYPYFYRGTTVISPTLNAIMNYDENKKEVFVKFISNSHVPADKQSMLSYDTNAFLLNSFNTTSLANEISRDFADTDSITMNFEYSTKDKTETRRHKFVAKSLFRVK